MGHSYRGHGYKDEYYSPETLANQQKAYRYFRLSFESPPATLGEVHFFASSGSKLNPNGVSTTSAPPVVYPGDSNLGLLVDDSLETCWENSVGSTALVFDFGAPAMVQQYEIGAGINALSLSWNLEGSSSSPEGPWEELDSTPSAQAIAATSFAVNFLGEQFRCPSGYETSSTFDYTTQATEPAATSGLR
jgi:hypothetical protein